MATSEHRLREWIAHWDQHSFGYWAVETLDPLESTDAAEPRAAGSVIGFAGLRRTRWLDSDVLNLYYRFEQAAWGRGFAAEAARHAVLLGTLYFPDVPVIARTKPENVPSQRTALAAGLHRRTDLDGADGAGQSVIFSTFGPEGTGRTR